jgi:hypothetical protein
MEISHFGHSLEINARVKLLLSCVHGGTLWLVPLVSIDTELIAWIIGLAKVGEDPTTFFRKTGEKVQLEAMKEKFHTFRGKKELDVANINDDFVQFAT